MIFQVILQHLQLNFEWCEALSDVGELGRGVGNLRGLQHLQLGFGDCRALSDLGELGRSVGNLQGLQHVQLDFSSCSALPSTLQRNFATKDDFVAAVGL